MSEILVGTVATASEALGMTQVFVGVFVVAIVGNAAEHSTAVWMALKNQMDLAVGIAMGSALQIALFVAPVLVFASYLRPEPMDLLFTPLEVAAMFLGVIIAYMVAEDGESNWLEGAMLLLIYVDPWHGLLLPAQAGSRPSDASAPVRTHDTFSRNDGRRGERPFQRRSSGSVCCTSGTEDFTHDAPHLTRDRLPGAGFPDGFCRRQGVDPRGRQEGPGRASGDVDPGRDGNRG